mmetsp:Transcript_8656/g.21313  ORF Transcript_8656/g.21313 Transcript_8656/m.21313 type:complete len:176 (-) Transcript_8656:194-721(-)
MEVNKGLQSKQEMEVASRVSRKESQSKNRALNGVRKIVRLEIEAKVGVGVRATKVNNGLQSKQKMVVVTPREVRLPFKSDASANQPQKSTIRPLLAFRRNQLNRAVHPATQGVDTQKQCPLLSNRYPMRMRRVELLTDDFRQRPKCECHARCLARAKHFQDQFSANCLFLLHVVK